MLRVTHRYLYKDGNLIAIQKMNMLVANQEEADFECAKTLKKYKHTTNKYTAIFKTEPYTKDQVKDDYVQLKLF